MIKSPLFIFLPAFATSVFLAYSLYLLKPIGYEGAATVIIEPGQGARSVAVELARAGAIRSPKMFLVYSALSGAVGRIKAGEYSIPFSAGLPEVVELLVSGPPDIKITIIEGENISEIDVKLSRLGVISPGELVNFKLAGSRKEFDFLDSAKSLEGFLLPDTYFFVLKTSPEKVVRRFLDNFQQKAAPLLYQSKTRSRSYQLLILASLIEKEVPFPEDRLLVAGVLQKRLKIGMPLQVDAEPWTYQNYGLPPRPIANPGLGAIYAALNPKSSPYLYYLSDPKTKKTIFSETFGEHNDNRARYLSY